MSRIGRYPIAETMQRFCQVLDLPPVRVLRRAGFPDDFLANEGKGVLPADFFRLWDAAVVEAGRPDLPIYLGKLFSRGPFNSALFAFSCSPDVETGLKRLALFKPLVGPMSLDLASTHEGLDISFSSNDPQVQVPASMSAFELVFFLEIVRFYTGREISPIAVSFGGADSTRGELERYFQMPVERGAKTMLSISREDADRKLVSENEEMWLFFEPQLRRRLAERDQQTPAHIRVKNALLEMLPAGAATTDSVCEKLRISKRSLQRQLKEEGHSYQAILDATRSELSLLYLSRKEMSVEEISYLLAFRDPNSFYRAFHSWTGMTPQQARDRVRL